MDEVDIEIANALMASYLALYEKYDVSPVDFAARVRQMLDRALWAAIMQAKMDRRLRYEYGG